VRDLFLLGEWGEREAPFIENSEVPIVAAARDLQSQEGKVVESRVVKLLVRKENLGSVGTKNEWEVDVLEASRVVAENDQR
jgi:hypothetical protein